MAAMMKLWESYYDALKRQDWKGALSALKYLSKREPDNPQVYLKIGDLFRRTEDMDDATEAYHESARLLKGQGFFQKAIAVYKIILSINPDDTEAINRLKEGIKGIETVRAAMAKPVSAPDELRIQEREEVEVHPFSKGLPAIFSFLKEEEALAILRKGEVRYFHDGQKVIEEGDSGDSIFIIRSGHAKVIAHIMGKEIELATLSEGDVFGEVGFLTGRLRTASVISIGNLEVTELGRVILEEIIERNPEVLDRIEDIYVSRVEDTVSKVKSLKGIRHQ